MALAVPPNPDVARLMKETNPRNNYGNVLGRFMIDRRIGKARDIVKQFGAMVLARHAGMGDYMSRMLFGASGQENRIQWTVDEIQRLMAANSGSSESSILNGTGNSRWPIAPTYDYLITLDQVVADILAETERLKSYPALSVAEQQAVKKRVIHPDFRPWWYHETGQELGVVDKDGHVITEGQALGSDMKYNPVGGGVGSREPTPKDKYEIACDAALLFNYVHVHNIVALSQGLFKVNFTATNKLSFANASHVSAVKAPPGSWVNAFDVYAPPGGGTFTSAEAMRAKKMHVLAAQETDLSCYRDNHFWVNRLDNGIDKAGIAANFAFNAGTVPQKATEGGAMATLSVFKDGGNMIPAPPHATEINVDHFRQAAIAMGGTHPVHYTNIFREITAALGIDSALRNLHMDMQVLLADMIRTYSRNSYAPNDLHAIVNRSTCPPGSARVYVDAKGRYAPPIIMTPKGPVRNPALVGGGTCRNIVRSQDDPAFFGAALSSNFGLGSDMPGMPFGAGAMTMGTLYRARKKRSSSRKKSSSRKRSSSRRRSSRSRSRARTSAFAASARKRSSSRKKSGRRPASRKKKTGRRSASRRRSSSRARTSFSFGAAARKRKSSRKKGGSRKKRGGSRKKKGGRR